MQVLGQVDIHRECEEESRLVKSFFKFYFKCALFNNIVEAVASFHKGYIFSILFF